MGLVDDQDGGHLALVGQQVAAAAQSQHHALAKGRHRLAELAEHLAVQPGDADEGVGGVDDDEAGRVEPVDEGAQGGGLARADLAGDQADAALADQEAQAGLELLLAGGHEELAGGQAAAEGGDAEAVELLEHLTPPVVGDRRPRRWMTGRAARLGRS